MTSSIPNYNNSIFLVEVEKIRPNPYQPRRDFDQNALSDLADSVRQYGILQPLVVTRHEEISEEGGLRVYYELIAGERRLRAAKIAGLANVPVIIRTGEETNKMKLELAIIENLQREDLNAIDRAQAFDQLTGEFGMTHAEVGKKMGKSREYVSNSLRLLQLPLEIQEALKQGKISEGHSRPIMMLRDQPQEQIALFKEIVYKKLSVRDAEKIARGIAVDKVRKIDGDQDPTILEYEKKFAEKLGTRVLIEKRQKGAGGRIMIDFLSPLDLENFLSLMKSAQPTDPQSLMNKYFGSAVLNKEDKVIESIEEKKDFVEKDNYFSENFLIPEFEDEDYVDEETVIEKDELSESPIDDTTVDDPEFDDFDFLDDIQMSPEPKIIEDKKPVSLSDFNFNSDIDLSEKNIVSEGNLNVSKEVDLENNFKKEDELLKEIDSFSMDFNNFTHKKNEEDDQVIKRNEDPVSLQNNIIPKKRDELVFLDDDSSSSISSVSQNFNYQKNSDPYRDQI